jgi:hypothetical protein
LTQPVTWFEGDTSPVRVKVGADLSGATAEFHVHPFADRTRLSAILPVVVSDPASGVCLVAPSPDVAAGVYWADLHVTNATGTRTTIPLRLEVLAHALEVTE